MGCVHKQWTPVVSGSSVIAQCCNCACVGRIIYEHTGQEYFPSVIWKKNIEESDPSDTDSFFELETTEYILEDEE